MEIIMFCKNCGEKIDDSAVTCPKCGAATGVVPTQDDTIFCSNCGQKISRKALICPHCGVATEQYRKEQEKTNQQAAQPAISIVNANNNVNSNAGFAFPLKNKWTAFFLCLFLGGIGAHRFYVGKSGTGILYLFTCGLFGIGWVVDLIMIPLGGLKDKWGRPLV